MSRIKELSGGMGEDGREKRSEENATATEEAVT